MIYTFARIDALLQMNVNNYFSQGRRGWVRLHEKGGKENGAPCEPKLETFLDEYIAAVTDGPLFRTLPSGLLLRLRLRRINHLTSNVSQQYLRIIVKHRF